MNDLGLNQLYAEQKKLEGSRERPSAATAGDARDASAATASESNSSEASDAAQSASARAATNGNAAAQGEAKVEPETQGAAAAASDGVRRRRGLLARLGFS